MAVECIDSFLVQPARGVGGHEQRPGARLPNSGRLFAMLDELFHAASKDCRIGIIFRSENGRQENDCRTLLLQHLGKPTAARARLLASRLALCTSNTSGIALLFVMCGKVDGIHRIVLARFPADQGVLAEERGDNLTVEFVEKVFMKSARSYKSALYTTQSLDSGFWKGKAVDKQINGPQEISEYWIGAFLGSDLATTGTAGTRRLGDAIRRAARDTPSDTVRAKLVAAAYLIPGMAGKKVAARQLLQNLAVPEEGISAVQKAMGREELMEERFQLNAEEFTRAAKYRSVELDNGALLMAETSRFDDVFTTSRVAEGRVRYTTEGHVISEKLRKQK